MDEMEIYLANCGSNCPYDGDCGCNMRSENGICSLETPWFDCDFFIQHNANKISAAELELENNA